MHNQASLDEVVILINDAGRVGKVTREGENPETGAASSQAPLVPEVVYDWHSHARGTSNQAMEEHSSKQRSRPFRTPTRNITGSGMQYNPREITPSDNPNPELRQETRKEDNQGTKRRSQPFRKVKPKEGITFPVANQHTASPDNNKELDHNRT